LLTVQEARRFCDFLRQLQARNSWSVRQLALAVEAEVSRTRLRVWLDSAPPAIRRRTAEKVAKLLGEELSTLVAKSRDIHRLSGLDAVITRAGGFNRPGADLMLRALHEFFLYLREWGVEVSLTCQYRSSGDEATLRAPLGSSQCHAQINFEPSLHGFAFTVQIVKGAARTPTMEGILTLESARRLRLHLRELARREHQAETLRFQVDRKSTSFFNQAQRA
jgi:hypothetical protein